MGWHLTPRLSGRATLAAHRERWATKGRRIGAVAVKRQSLFRVVHTVVTPRSSGSITIGMGSYWRTTVPRDRKSPARG